MRNVAQCEQRGMQHQKAYQVKDRKVQRQRALFYALHHNLFPCLRQMGQNLKPFVHIARHFDLSKRLDFLLSA